MKSRIEIDLFSVLVTLVSITGIGLMIWAGIGIFTLLHSMPLPPMPG